MVLGWRRAFCTSISRDQDAKVIKDKSYQGGAGPGGSANPSPRLGIKFGFFSNPSTPRLHRSHPVSSPSFRCRTAAASSPRPPSAAPVPAPSSAAASADSPKLRCKTKSNGPTFFTRSNPSSPRSPSTFSLHQSTLRLSKERCGICLQRTSAGQGMAIFTAECTHTFHLPCIAAVMEKKVGLSCPVCSSSWKESPVLTNLHLQKPAIEEQKRASNQVARAKINDGKKWTGPALKVYNDDEPLMSPTSGARFIPIPESDENENENENEEITNSCPATAPVLSSRAVEVKLLPDAALVSIERSSETYAIILKLIAPPAPSKSVGRAPVDLVTVLDVSGSMTAEKLRLMRRAMRLILSSLSSTDRLSIVAFSAASKRLLPLRRMTTSGRRSARRILDAIVALEGRSSASDALKKAAKVLGDRREKNPVASIILLSDGQDDRSSKSGNQSRQSAAVYSARFDHMEIPVHWIGLREAGCHGNAETEEALTMCIRNALNVVVQDLRLQMGIVSGSSPAEIAAVYSYAGRPAVLGSSSIQVGEMYGDEEREVLMEVKVPASSSGAHHVLSVCCGYRDPSTLQPILGRDQAVLLPRLRSARSTTPATERLKNLFVSTRAVAESRRHVEGGDPLGAYQMLSSALTTLMQSASPPAEELVRTLEAELSELHSRIQRRKRDAAAYSGDEKGEQQLTPTSAWKAAERLAKLAIMRKSLNRVSDLHGLEDARF